MSKSSYGHQYMGQMVRVLGVMVGLVLGVVVQAALSQDIVGFLTTKPVSAYHLIGAVIGAVMSLVFGHLYWKRTEHQSTFS